MSLKNRNSASYSKSFARVVLVVSFLATASFAAAQSGAPTANVVRDGEGGTTVRATRVTTPIVVDGRLDDEVYSRVASIGGFVQQEPEEGAPVTEKTEVWLLYDDQNIYVAARCEDSHPERDVANEMRRDGQSTNDNESFAVLFDTFHDRRNGYMFQATLAGGLFDGYITDERDMNRDWNTVWDARTSRGDHVWTVEIVIPFKSLRFRGGAEQDWGVNFKRVVRWKNELQYLTRIPASLGRRGMNKVSSAATLTGLELPPSRRVYELKPYAIGGSTLNRPASGTSTTDGRGDVGADLKVGLTEGMTADFTYNTDFAQVEEDEQQVNLTRFSVLFPEKREFFLEGQGIFAFGGAQPPPRGGGGGSGVPANPNYNDVPWLFFSRRVGLNAGKEIPIDVGGRVTGKSGPYSVGVLDIRTGEASGSPATNFAVARIKRDILRRSAVGVVYTERSTSSSGGGPARAGGIDALFSFFQNVNVNTYFAGTNAEEGEGRRTSYRAQFDYNADRYGFQAERLALGERFHPDVGFLRRQAFARNSVYGRFSPRPAGGRVRKYTVDGVTDYITDSRGSLESQLVQGAFRVDLQSGDNFSIEAADNYERLVTPFEVSNGVVLPVGEYRFQEVHGIYFFGPQRLLTGNVTVERGSFYDGTRTSVATSRGRVQLTSQLSIEPGLRIEWVRLPQGDFTQTLFSSRVSYTLTPRTSVSALSQYNSSQATFTTTARFRWEYQPGSDLFVVFNDNRDTLPAGFPELRNRGIVLKFTRLFRM